METIVVDGCTYDPYFIMDVTPSDAEAHVTKQFRRKAKKLHPDKFKNDSVSIEHRNSMFRVLLESYDHIINKLQRSNAIDAAPVEVRTFDVKPSELRTREHVDNFNQKFEEVAGLDKCTPNDFGYGDQHRLKTVEEYEAAPRKPCNVFRGRKFSKDEFNDMFEYNSTVQGKERGSSSALIHKTTDGFYGYNSGDLNNCSAVSSYNGVLLVGDDFGRSGVGYYSTSYSDYKHTFDVAVNPEKPLEVPSSFSKERRTKEACMNAPSVSMDTAQRRRAMIPQVGSSSRAAFKQQEQQLLKQQQEALKEKVVRDRAFVMEYKHMYPSHLLEGRSPDRKI